MTILWKSTCAMLVGAMLSCGGKQEPAETPADGERDQSEPETAEQKRRDLEAQFQREADPIQKQPLKAAGSWTAYMEGKSPPTYERTENLLAITADLGWDNPVQCFVYDSTIDAASATQVMLAAAEENVDFTSVAAYGLEHDNLDPIITIRGVYQVMQNDVLAAGDYKLMVMPRQKFPIVCVHDAPGYAKSFTRVTSEFAKSFQYENKVPTPIRGELWSVTLDGRVIGFSQQKNYETKEGKIRRVSISARLLPTAPGELAFQDKVSVINSDRKGVLLDGTYVTNDNGATSLRLDLEKTKRGYTYAGTVQGKEISGDFRTRKPLEGAYAFEKRLKNITSRKKLSFVQQEYVPGLDPTKPVAVKYEASPEAEGYGILAEMGASAMQLHADDRGILRNAWSRIGSKKMQMELLEELGDL